MRDDVRKKLIEVAKNGETITYGALMKEFGIPRGHQKPEIGIAGAVDAINGYERAKGHPLLSAIVVRANSKTKICPKGHPGGGFFGLEGIPGHLKRFKDHTKATLTTGEKEFVREEQEKVWSYWKTHDDED